MITAFRRWKERRYWQKRHLEALQVMLDEDYRWLVDDPVGKAIAERHQRMAKASWYQTDHEPVPQFRERMRRLAAESLKPAEPPEDLAEKFIQAAIDRSPEPLRRLGSYLAELLDEDHWATAERMLLGAAEASVAVAAENERMADAVSKLNARPVGPDRCPFTGRPFWGNIEHPELGEVATYGGPFDTYTLPTRTDEDPDYCVHRYDHDRGNWITDSVESIGMKLVDDQLYTSEDDPAELRARAEAAEAKLSTLQRMAACGTVDSIMSKPEFIREFIALGINESSRRKAAEERYAALCEAEPVAWLIDWPDEPDLGHYFAESPTADNRSVPLIPRPSMPK